MSSSSPGAQLEPALESPEWKHEINQRLAAHRTRRGGFAQPALPGMEPGSAAKPPARGKSVAERVAARYAHAPSYSEMLAIEAQNAARAAEAAMKAANEVHAAAQAILVGLDTREPDAASGEIPEPEPQKTFRARIPAHLAVRQEPFPVAPSSRAAVAQPVEENDPLADALITPVQPLPAKLLEFPRELVAARKARPRFAEGPLREEPGQGSERPQLRIFEVENEAISTEPVVDPVLPHWSSIRLDARPASGRAEVDHVTEAGTVRENLHPNTAFELPLQTAPLEDRMMAAIVDTSLVLVGFLLFLLVFAACTAHLPSGKPALAGAALALFTFGLLYQVLFFRFGQDTPGMRYAKVALCTFDDENPTRKAMVRRIGALLLSACPMGLGLLWAFFDDDRLGWHDRISRTYQRSYR